MSFHYRYTTSICSCSGQCITKPNRQILYPRYFASSFVFLLFFKSSGTAPIWPLSQNILVFSLLWCLQSHKLYLSKISIGDFVSPRYAPYSTVASHLKNLQFFQLVFLEGASFYPHTTARNVPLKHSHLKFDIFSVIQTIRNYFNYVYPGTQILLILPFLLWCLQYLRLHGSVLFLIAIHCILWKLA